MNEKNGFELGVGSCGYSLGVRGGGVMGEILSETEYIAAVFDDHDFSDQVAVRVTYSKCRLMKTLLARTRIQNLDLDRVEIDSCDVANAIWEECRLDKVRMNECRLTGIGLAKSLIKESVFQSCQAAYADFRFVKFKKTKFIECELKGADFQQADLRNVVFENCCLNEAQFSFAKLEGTDFRGSTIENLRVGIEHLRGAIVDATQAAYLAGLMGLRVMW